MAARSAPARLQLLAARLRDGGADRDLLREFVSSRSHPAFAELVRRYGPLVFGVCRRALNHRQDAEDAFQATFLVLARRAARITAPEKLAGWLHSVAVRTATEIRHMRDRPKSANWNRDRQGAGVCDLANRDREGAGSTAEQRELAAALDAELAALPDHYRLPVVLCELRGLTRKQAADELKIAEGTLSSRLAKARKLLAERLANRGFAASVAGVSAALAGTATAGVSDSLTILATDLAIGINDGIIATSISVASDTVVKAMFATKLKSVVLAGGLLVALAGGLLLVPGGAGAQPGGPTPTAKGKADPADGLVQQLGSKEFADREAAEKELLKLGVKAVAAVRAGVRSDVPEVAARSERLLAAIRKDDAEQFAKKFLADKEFKETFAHPIWTRWAKTVGDDRGSRELFAEVLGADGAAATLNRLAESPEAAKTVYPAELARMHAHVAPRADIGNNRRLMWHLCYSLGEAAYVLYLGTFDGAVSVKPERTRGPEAADPEVEALELLFHLEWKKRGPWVLEKEGLHQPGNRVLVPPLHKLMVAALLNLKNPVAIQNALRTSGGLREADKDSAVCLPLARMTCREKSFPLVTRAASWIYMAEAGEAEYLPDMAEYQTDATRVQQFWRSDEKSREYNTLVSDVSIAAQLILHGKKPTDYGYLARLNNGKTTPDRSCFAYGFPDAATRKAVHEKALAYLKDAPKPEPKKDPDPEQLVKQLGSNDFAEREAAEGKLREMGVAAVAAVRAGLKSDVPEIAERCARLLPKLREAYSAEFRTAFRDGWKRGDTFDHPLWKRYVATVGDSKASRELFNHLITVGDSWFKTLDAAADDPTAAITAYRTAAEELDRITRSNQSVSFRIPVWPGMTTTEAAYLLFLGSLCDTEPLTHGDGNLRWAANGEGIMLRGDGLRNGLAGKRSELVSQDDKRPEQLTLTYTDAELGTDKVFARLYAHWLERKTIPDGNWVDADPFSAQAFNSHQFSELLASESLPVARRRIADATAKPLERAIWIPVLRRCGAPADAKLLAKLFDEKTVLPSRGAQFSLDTTRVEVREWAVGTALLLRDKSPAEFGFDRFANLKTQSMTTVGEIGWPPPGLFAVHELGTGAFVSEVKASDPERKEAVLKAAIRWLGDEAKNEVSDGEKEKVLFKLAPIPKAKSVLPKKLDKVPDPPDELRKELVRFDETYRHGTPEKFTELETKADGLAKRFPEKDDQARIWYEVAHVAAQSDIRKQAERVRKYAAKCLEVSRDPLQRGQLYSYLASAEEVSDGAFADNRRKAADWLLTGYLELLAQELPDEKPELPESVEILGQPGKRAINFAQRLLREEFQFTRDQIDRRDVLVQQLRDLYKPDAKRAGRDDKGPDELRELAAKKLPDDAAVKGLMEGVLK